MNSNTLRTVKQIKANGYYRQGITLGEGGWGEVYKLGYFKEYTLSGNGEIIETIHALDELTAVNAFKSLYHLDMFKYWDIEEIVHKFRTVTTS